MQTWRERTASSTTLRVSGAKSIDGQEEQLTEEQLEEMAIDEELNFQDLPVEELMARLPAYMFLEEGQRDEYFRQLNETYFNHSSSKKPTPVSKEGPQKKVEFMQKNKVKSNRG
jgi:hypothetical protein